jgi:hypothetical protein
MKCLFIDMQSLNLVITFDTNNIGTHVCNILQV